MVSQTKSVVIHAPVDKVFEYLDDPANEPDFWPSLVDVSDIQLLPNGGHSNHWTYKMAGVRLEGTSEDIEHVPNQRIVTKTEGGVDTLLKWMVEPQGADTKLTFQADYTVPFPVLGKLAEAVVVKLNEHEGDAILENIKAVLETS